MKRMSGTIHSVLETTTEWSWPEWMSFKLQTTMKDAFVEVRVREVCGTWLHHDRFGLNQARQAPVRLRIARGDLSQGGVHRKLVLAIETTTELSWPEWMFFKLQKTMKGHTVRRMSTFAQSFPG
jgi:hypothetical protein